MPYASTFTGSRPFRRGTPSSPVGNCTYLPFIYDIKLNAVCIDFYRFQAISTRDAIISSWKLYVFTFHLWYSIPMHLLTIVYRVQIISTRDAIISSWKLYVFTFHLWYSIRMHLLTIVYLNIEICCKCWYCWFFFLTFTGSSSDTADSFLWLLQVSGHFD